MTLQQFITLRERNICANFRVRHTSSMLPNSRRLQLARQRRATIRRFVHELRLARDEATAPFIAAAVADQVAPKLSDVA